MAPVREHRSFALEEPLRFRLTAEPLRFRLTAGPFRATLDSNMHETFMFWP